jgi:flagellar motor switch protein FliG
VEDVNKKQDLSGLQKAVTLLIALGPEQASRILKRFHGDKVELLSAEIANTQEINPDHIANVYQEFLVLSRARAAATSGGLNYAKQLLEKAFGPQRAEEIIRILLFNSKPFSEIRKIDPKQLVNFLNNEHPQTIALVLSNLTPEQSATILNYLPKEIQSDIAWRIATMERTSPEIVKEVEAALESRLSAISGKDFTAMGGVKDLVNILNMVDRGTEKSIIEALEKEDPALADEVKMMMFVFEDIVTLDDPAIRRVLQDVDSKDLAMALKGANKDVEEKIFKNMSQRAKEILKEDIELLGPVRVRDVEEKQQRIVQIIRKLDESGEIIIVRGGAQNALIV